MNHTKKTLLYIVLILTLIFPRAVNLAAFTAADEPFWLLVGANYYYALTHREFENTIYEYHPAVTTMWIGTAAMLIYYPEYRAIADGYIHQEKTLFDTFLLEHGKDPLELLWWARVIQMLVNVTLILISFMLLRYLLDEWIALIALLIYSVAPYLFGQSRMLNHESMVGLFSLISILAISAYLFRGNKPGLLILSAGAAALANLTKSSSIVLLPVVAFIVSAWAVMEWKRDADSRRIFLSAVKVYALWLVLLILVYVITWPGMWVAPGKMLYEIYGNGLSYAFQGARLSVTQELEPSNFGFDSAGSGILSFLISIAWRTTPITWIGLLLAVVVLFHRNREVIPVTAKWLIIFLLIEAFVSITMFGVIRGRNSPHYVLAAYVCFEVVAALGWAYALCWLKSLFFWARKVPVQVTLIAVILLFQGVGLLHTAPYYYTYLNPILGAVNQGNLPRFFYGERLEEAASYLSAKPDAQHLTVLVYFGRSFSYYFPGKTLLFKPVLFEDKAQLIENLQQADYLVIYSGLEERLPLLKEMTPEHLIYLNGMEYVQIYPVSNVPPAFFDE